MSTGTFAGTAVSTIALAAIVGAGLMVRARQQSEVKLREKEAQVALMTRSARVGLWRWDFKTRQFWGSDVCMKMLGAEAGDRNYESVLSHIHPDDRGAFDTLVRCPHGAMTVEARIQGTNDHVRWIVSTGTAMHAPGRRLVCTTGVVLDVTGRKRSAEELRAQRSKLTHLSRLALIGQFSGTLAHEVTQPLTSILSNAQTAENLLAKDPPDLNELRHILADIVGHDLRAASIVKRIKAFLYHGEINLEPTDVKQLVTDSLSIVRAELRERRIRTRTQLPSLPLVLADRVQIEQVVLNLLVNAADAMSELPAMQREIEVSATHDSHMVTVSITDHGPGIAENKLKEVFKPFYSSKSEGLGLGLAISRSIIAAHGGELWAVNNPEGGATLQFTLRDAPVPYPADNAARTGLGAKASLQHERQV
jgi:C4-dicarboxylate-specific signal transduction histidine kinase